MAPALDRPAVLGAVTLLLVVGGIGLAVAPAGALTTTDSTDANNYDLWWGDGGEDLTLDSANAEVTGETADGEVSAVTFQYDAPDGELVMLQVGDETEIVFSTGVERTSTVDMGGYFWSDTEEYPVNVSAEIIGGERCSATVTQGDGVVTLCEDDDGEAAYDLSVDSNSPVTEGEDATVDATVENTGDAEGTEDVTVEVADRSTTESVTLDAGDSETVTLDWQTEANDAGDYTATAAVAGQTASTDVTVEPAVTDGTIEGTVTDNETGESIENATVSAGDAATATTDADGNYTLTVESGNYTLSADADGYQSASQSVSVDAGETSTADFQLEPVLESVDVSLAGFGEDPEIAMGESPQIQVNATYSNDVVEDVSSPDIVSSDNPSVLEAGQFLGVPIAQTNSTGEATLTAEYEGETDSINVTVGPAELTTREITVRDELAVGDTQQGIVQEVWTDGSTVDVTENFTVASSDESIASVENSDESVIVTGESAGDVTLTATETDGDVEFAQDLTVSDAEIEVAGNESAAGAGFTTAVGFDAQSLVGDEVNVTEYTVALDLGHEDVSLVDVHGADSETDGDVVLVSDAPGGQTPADLFTVELQVSDNATAGDEIPIEVVDSRSEIVEESGGFFSDPVYALPTWTDGAVAVEEATVGTVEGTVTDDETGDAIEGATVATEQSSTTTDANGDYSLELQPGEYEMDVTHDDYVDATVDANVTEGDTTTADVALTPLDFQAYVAGEEGYLHTNTSAENVSAIEFTESEDFEPTQDAIDAEPDYLPEPEAITVEGVIDEENGTWEGDAYFPVSVSERDNAILGEIYSEAQITPVDGVEGTIDRESGEMTLETEVNISIAIYTLDDGHGTPWEERGDPTTPETCHIPSVQLETTTETSGDMTGERLENGTATLVGNEFPIDGSQGCGGLFTGPINDAQGIPTAEGDAEVLFDLVFEFAEPAEPEPETGTIEGTVTDDGTGDAIENATVEAAGQSTTTDASGAYSLTVDAGDHAVDVSADGYEAASQNVSVTAGETTTQDFALTAEPEPEPEVESVDLSLADGTLTEDESTDATVEANYDNGTAVDVTDAASLASDATDVATVADSTVTAESAGTANVTATYDGVTSDPVTLTVEAPAPDPADFQIDSVDTNSPVTAGEDVTVDATVENVGEQEETQTVHLDGDGLGTDDEELTLGAGENDTASLSVGTSEGDDGDYTVEVSTDNDTATADVTIEEAVTTGTIEGTVTDADSGDAIEGASVSAGDASATTDANGDYSLTVEEGDYTVEVDAEGYQSGSQDVSVTAGETTTQDVALDPEAPEPQDFEAYVAGDEGYLDTNASDPEVEPTEFTECEDFTPTESANQSSPDYLPDPECITMEGTYFPSNDSWQGDVQFPASVSETESALGETYAEAEITTIDGAEGTMDPDAETMTLDTEVNINVAVYNVDSQSGWGTPWEDRGEPITDDTCHIPNVGLETTTGESGDLTGEPLEDDTATLVGNEFGIDSAQDCGELLGGAIALDESINDAQGIPTESGQSEVVFDAVFEFTGN